MFGEREEFQFRRRHYANSLNGKYGKLAGDQDLSCLYPECPSYSQMLIQSIRALFVYMYSVFS